MDETGYLGSLRPQQGRKTDDDDSPGTFSWDTMQTRGILCNMYINFYKKCILSIYNSNDYVFGTQCLH